MSADFLSRCTHPISSKGAFVLRAQYSGFLPRISSCSLINRHGINWISVVNINNWLGCFVLIAYLENVLSRTYTQAKLNLVIIVAQQQCNLN